MTQSPENKTDSILRHSNWAKFFSAYKVFEKRVAAQKMRGVNDFNLLTTVLSVHDERRLHSRFIAAFLDPRGVHGQGAIFLEAFLRIILRTGISNSDFVGKLSEWKFDVENAVVRREHDNMDIHITDDTRHIIIENKVNALDPCRQAERYIKQIRYDDLGDEQMVENDVQVEANDLLFIYLSKNRCQPRGKSLGCYQLDETHSCLVCAKAPNTPVAHYQNAHYESEILDWIDDCRAYVGNLTNLNYALNEYRQVVERLNRTYTSKLMSLDSFLNDSTHGASSADRVRMALDIECQMPKIKASWLKYIMEEAPDEWLASRLGDSCLERVDGEQACGGLDLSLFKSSHADLYFSRNSRYRKKGRNKAAVWRFTEGPYADSLALVLAYGTKHLHIGVLPVNVKVAEKGITKVYPRLEVSFSNDFVVELDGQAEKLESKDLGDGLKGLRSWHACLRDAMIHMTDEKSTSKHGVPLDFAKSRHAAVLITIAKHYLRGL